MTGEDIETEGSIIIFSLSLCNDEIVTMLAMIESKCVLEFPLCEPEVWEFEERERVKEVIDEKERVYPSKSIKSFL